MEVQNETGSITIGKKANLIFTKPVSSVAYLPYAFGSNMIDKVNDQRRICIMAE
jgi:imidazolonepropionase